MTLLSVFSDSVDVLDVVGHIVFILLLRVLGRLSLIRGVCAEMLFRGLLVLQGGILEIRLGVVPIFGRLNTRSFKVVFSLHGGASRLNHFY